jgi:hypothetical protein
VGDRRTGVSSKSQNTFAVSLDIKSPSKSQRRQAETRKHQTSCPSQSAQEARAIISETLHDERTCISSRSNDTTTTTLTPEASQCIVAMASSKHDATSLKQISLRARRSEKHSHRNAKRTVKHPTREQRNHVHLYWHLKRLKTTTGLAR